MKLEEQVHQSTEDQAKAEGLLYHYTDQKGLLGILEGGSIWATHIRFLNDLSESREALDHWSAVLKELNSTNPLLPQAYWPAAQWAVEFAVEEFAPYVTSSRKIQIQSLGETG